MNSVGRKFRNRGFAQSLMTRLQSSTCTTGSNNTKPEIEIPVRKVRGPTDLLKALESTISRDPTAPAYKYHDDPYLIPYSNMQKRTFALSQESGRKAAKWIREQHANLFQHRLADPVIESYLPKAVYDQKENVSEEILKTVIAHGHATDALQIYQLLEEEVSIETKQALLELLCFYNNEKVDVDNSLTEEKWFQNTSGDVKNTWKNSPEIEKLFASLIKEGNDEKIIAGAYNAMICGLAKYNKSERAFNLFEKAEGKNIVFSVTTFNSLIQFIPTLHEGNTERIHYLTDFLRKIKNAGIHPNIGTFNSALKVASTITNEKSAKDLCRSLFSEFKAIGVEPSLASYNFVLQIFYRRNYGPSSALRDVIRDLEGKEMKIQDKLDLSFFITAMNIATNKLDDPVLGDKVHRLLLSNDNYNFIGDGFKENNYYRNFLRLQVQNQDFETFVNKYYDILVPNVYTPEPSVMDEILNAIAANIPEISRNFMPRFWTHIVQFQYLERKNLIGKALNLMRTHCKPITEDSNDHQIFGEAAWAVWTYVNRQKELRVQQVNWSGPILGDVAVLCLRAGNYERWSGIISYIFNEQNSIIGLLEVPQVNELLDECILRGHVGPALDLVNYCSDNSFEETPSMAHKIYQNLPMLEFEKNRLESLVDPKVLNMEMKESQ